MSEISENNVKLFAIYSKICNIKWMPIFINYYRATKDWKIRCISTSAISFEFMNNQT